MHCPTSDRPPTWPHIYISLHSTAFLNWSESGAEEAGKQAYLPSSSGFLADADLDPKKVDDGGWLDARGGLLDERGREAHMCVVLNALADDDVSCLFMLVHGQIFRCSTVLLTWTAVWLDSFLYIFDAIIRGSHAHVDDIMWARSLW